MHPDHVPYLLCEERPLEQIQFHSQHLREGLLHASLGSQGVFRALQDWEGRLADTQQLRCTHLSSRPALPSHQLFGHLCQFRPWLSSSATESNLVLRGETFISPILVKQMTCIKPHCMLLEKRKLMFDTLHVETACDGTPNQVCALSSSAPSQPSSD